MDRVSKRYDTGRQSVPDEKHQGEARSEANRRQAAAERLRAARLTDDEAERASLRRQAAELLSGRRRRP